MQPFSLEPVLKFREQLEVEARQELSSSLRRQAELETRLSALRNDLAALYRDVAAIQRQGTTVDQLLLFESRISVLQEQLQSVAKDLEEQKQLVRRKRKKLLRASQDKKALEKLKQRQNQAYRRYLQKKEVTMLDEIAVLHYKR